MIVIIAPFGSGKTTLASKLGGNVLYNTDHTVFDRSEFVGKYEELAYEIQVAIMHNHHDLIKSTLNTRELVMDSGFIEHKFYNQAKYMIGRYSLEKKRIIDRMHSELSKDIPKPDVTIRLHTSVKQTVQNIIARGRRPVKDVDGLFSYISILKDQYDNYKADIDFNFGDDVNDLVSALRR